ncbi:MAG: hypothetical protein WCI34_05605 [Actinomycetes bacterium]
MKMQRTTLQRVLGLTVLPAALIASLAVPAIAAAPVIEIGGLGGLAAPSCTGTPANDRGAPKGLGHCSVLTMTTVYPIRDSGTNNPTTVPVNSTLVALTLRVGTLKDSKTCTKYRYHWVRSKIRGVTKRRWTKYCATYDVFAEKAYFDKTFGTGSKVRLVVLRPSVKPRGSHAVILKKVVAMGPMISLERYFGRKVTLALSTSIPVLKGDVVALSVPTYAPILPLAGSGTTDAWRASRPPAGFKPKDPVTGLTITTDPATHKPADPCSTKFGVIFAQSSLLTSGKIADFRCSYPGVPTFEFTLIKSG